MTFKGNELRPLAYGFNPKDPTVPEMNGIPSSIEISYRSKSGGTLLYVEDGDIYFEIAVFRNQVTIQWQLTTELPVQTRFTKDNKDFGWHTIYLRINDNKLEGGWKGWEQPHLNDPQPLLSAEIDANAYRHLFSGKFMIYLGGMPSMDSQLYLNSVNKNKGAIYKGCLGETRVGGLLLPFFSQGDIYKENFLLGQHFSLNSSVPEEGCILCIEQDCKNGGKCGNPAEQYACDCPLGYEKDDCSQNIDECLSAKCTNNSTCVDGIADYTCKCLPGYTGKYCESEINECLSEPCHNGGNCTDLLAEYKCDCPEDYAGSQCDILKLVTCDNQPCRNGSSCTDGYSRFYAKLLFVNYIK